MRSFRTVIGLSLVIGTSVAAGHALTRLSEQATSGAGAKASQASAGTLPKDIYPDTGNRLPAIKREGLDEVGKKLYDARGREMLSVRGESGSIAHPWPIT